MALSRLEKQVGRLAVDLPQPDPVLQRLLRLTDLRDAGYIGLSISVVTAGKLIHGNLMGTRAYLERLDDDLDKALTKFASNLDEGDPTREAAEEWRDAIEGNFAAAYHKQREREREHEETLDRISDERDTDRDALLLDDLPDDVAADDIALHPSPARTTLVLDNAVLLNPPLGEEHIGIVRIPIAQIGAWWLNMGLDGDDDGEDQ
jgi:hypothetical protein